MAYCLSTASMLPEEIWQIAKGFVEVLKIGRLNLKNVDKMFQMINNADMAQIVCEEWDLSQIICEEWEADHLGQIFHSSSGLHGGVLNV